MMQCFTRQYDSLSQINKHRIRFWAIAEFASLPPYSQVLPFKRKQVRKFGGKEKAKDWVFPAPDDLRTLLKLADTRMRCWIWMALGLGFGPGDICECMPGSFDEQDFNFARPKNEIRRWAFERNRYGFLRRGADAISLLDEAPPRGLV